MTKTTKIDTSPLVVCIAAWIQCGSPKTESTRLLREIVKKDKTLLERAIKYAVDTVDLDEASYKKKYGETFKESVEAAECGCFKKALRLIEWNKFFLSIKTIAKIIITAEVLCDTKRLNEISRAIKKTRKQKPHEHWFALGILKSVASRDAHPTEKDIVKAALEFGDKLNKEGWPDDDPTLNLLCDERDITKFLKRYWHLISSN